MNRTVQIPPAITIERHREGTLPVATRSALNARRIRSTHRPTRTLKPITPVSANARMKGLCICSTGQYSMIPARLAIVSLSEDISSILWLIPIPHIGLSLKYSKPTSIDSVCVLAEYERNGSFVIARIRSENDASKSKAVKVIALITINCTSGRSLSNSIKNGTAAKSNAAALPPVNNIMPSISITQP